jgi:hypothetical protein
MAEIETIYRRHQDLLSLGAVSRGRDLYDRWFQGGICGKADH